MSFGRSKTGMLAILAVVLIAGTLMRKMPASDVAGKGFAKAVGVKASASSNSDEKMLVTKVIDGDTLVVEGGDHVRLLGIDADEKGYPCYDAARLQLEALTLDKTVTLERDRTDKDQYGRLLRYVIADGKDVNEVLVSEGLAVARFLGDNVKHKQEIIAAEKQAIDNHIGCKWSK